MDLLIPHSFFFDIVLLFFNRALFLLMLIPTENDFNKMICMSNTSQNTFNVVFKRKGAWANQKLLDAQISS